MPFWLGALEWKLLLQSDERNRYVIILISNSFILIPFCVCLTHRYACGAIMFMLVLLLYKWTVTLNYLSLFSTAFWQAVKNSKYCCCRAFELKAVIKQSVFNIIKSDLKLDLKIPVWLLELLSLWDSPMLLSLMNLWLWLLYECQKECALVLLVDKTMHTDRQQNNFLNTLLFGWYDHGITLLCIINPKVYR